MIKTSSSHSFTLRELDPVVADRVEGKAPTRVQIPAYTDRWMMGDRYGEIVKTSKQRKLFPPRNSIMVRADARGTYIDIAHVKLDKSGKTVRVILDDCTVVS